ncbi:NFX1-type zinc finger-containing protein 1-like [Thrips palmi]|uniref:NFX1-type zinc finger-containing protein 1-like n=1 Tax=Thrips palmi TaxID=161013 RepID=A0A6P8Z351_THRPL|nr:NFX1-type zinc finger-containing protein 1-like [Thrips palmi]
MRVFSHQFEVLIQTVVHRTHPKRRCPPLHLRGHASLSPSSPPFTGCRNGSQDASRNPPREIGFRKLEQLAKDPPVILVEKLNEETTLALFKRLTSEKQLRDDWIRLVVTVLSKVCKAEYTNLVVPILSTIFQKQFIDQLLVHISRLSYDNNHNRKETVGDFFNELTVLCGGILELTPNLACENLDIILKRASQELEDVTHFEDCEKLKENLKDLREKLKSEKERLDSMKTGLSKQVSSSGFSMKPPNDFRELSHFPDIEDIVVQHRFEKPFLRPNKVNVQEQGHFQNVDDYLDVHFRLMREDFIRPLREGISDFRKSLELRKTSKGKRTPRIQNVRIYEKVKILHVKTEDENVGLVLHFDPEKKFASKIKWEYSKRLMMGSLLVLSENEEFSSIVLVTVHKRDQKELEEGKVVVELCEGGVVSLDSLQRQYLMVESQVFFGAYLPVLKALKNFNENNFPMADYIVYGSKEQKLPDYEVRALAAGKRFDVFLKPDDPSTIGSKVVVDVGDLNTWPSPSELGLDDSQYRALSGALANKLMLIQGPPGTGKTFIGLKIGAFLIQNQELWRSKEDPRPMLVVCYTNHALDQFLTGLMSVTNSIVRVGGGCKEPRLEQHSINFLRRNGTRPASLRQVYQNIRQSKNKFHAIKSLGDRIRGCSSQLKEDAAGIVSLDALHWFGIVPEEYLVLTDKDILMWLCGCRKNGEVPELVERDFSEHILQTEEPGFDHLEFSTEEMPNITMSFSFRQYEEFLRELLEAETPPRPYLTNLMEDLKRELSATEYPRYPEQQGQPRPAAIWRLNSNERFQLYRYWRDSLLTALSVFFEPLLGEIDATLPALSNELASWRMVEDQHIMADYAIIGMTTSFAASRQQILKELKPRIVIVEEAAEVFESHVLVCLAGEVEHLIMIGDHQQLRPNPSVHELGVKYHLNVSMFERLINNGVNYVTLSTQHRMRPEVARLICPAIYPNLKNHPSVAEFPAVLGVLKNVFFVDHQHHEEYLEDAQSHQNSHEAKFLSSLVKYLLLQGYDPSRITVLSTYKGQQYFFSKLKANSPHLKDVRMTVVDNFQGEESDIILLSLVRSNEEDNVGFLKTENRVCVALSRARHGLYIIGNMANMTKADTVWRKVEAELLQQGGIGPALPLHCDRHGEVTLVATAEDFAKCPQGGCLQLCKTLMPCGHDCKQVCHILDMEHKTARCMEKCERPACPQQHACPERCFRNPCPPCQVPKVEQLACGHSATMACHVDPAEYKCKVVVNCTLPDCGHEREAKCHQLARLELLPCKTPCTLRMLCGHTCRSDCHVRKDPNHEQVKCMQPCGQKRHGCLADPGHQCRLVCHQACEECTEQVQKTLPCGHKHKMKCNADASEFQCRLKCDRTLSCGHKCSKKCFEPCEPCTVQVSKTVPACGHAQVMSCGESPALFRNCKAPCERLLPCGHRCGLQCRQDCLGGRCRQMVPYPRAAACGHTISVPCSLKNDYAPNSSDLLALCRQPCRALLKPCDHQCGGSCGECLQGRLHQPCKSKCERQLLCGHVCKEACPKVCPPCTLPCEQKCIHSSCNHRCGIPCAPCKEPCSRRCAHGQCPRRCGDKCTFECKEACRAKVEDCGHDCIGLCGDPCVCKECNLEEVTTIFFGTEEEEGARFIMLPDCKHIVEAGSLDDWMSVDNTEDGKPSEIKPKVCPKCTAPITSCQRYSNVMKKVAMDIAAVKRQFYDKTKIQSHLDKTRELLKDISNFPIEFSSARVLTLDVVRFLEGVEKKMPRGRESGTRRVSPLNTSEAKNLEQKVQILRSLWRIVDKVVQDDSISSSGRTEIEQAVELLCSNLRQRDPVRLSEQEASDVSLALERLQRLVELLQVESGPSFRQLQASDKLAHADISRVVRGLSPYSEEQDLRIRKQLEALAASALVSISREELAAIVAAMDMLPGHWFRCPNGHPYCITECGGAMQEADCPVEGCGARIGGGNHQLRRDNTLAGDIDNARAPAWNNTMQYYEL